MTGQKTTGGSRLIRGGNWNNSSGNLASSNRNNNSPTNGNNNVGFRVAGSWPGRAFVRFLEEAKACGQNRGGRVPSATVPHSGTTGRSGGKSRKGFPANQQRPAAVSSLRGESRGGCHADYVEVWG